MIFCLVVSHATWVWIRFGLIGGCMDEKLLSKEISFYFLVTYEWEFQELIV